MADTIDYKCPCCGGVVEFDSATQQMKCPYCDTEFDVAAMQDHDAVLNTEAPEELNWEGDAGSEWSEDEAADMNVYRCKSCGGEIVADATTAATHCPYCGNPVMLTGRLSGDLKPDLVIPFKVDRDAAKNALAEHFKGKKLLPKLFSSGNHLDEIKGVYVPFWLYTADASADITYRAEKVRSWQDQRYIYNETSYFSVRRAGGIGFDRIPVDGSTKAADDMMDSLEPFDISEAVDFQTAYLSGYLADRYDVNAEESKDRAGKRIRETAANAFASTVSGYSGVRPEQTDIRLQSSKAEYALYPVWLLNTSWNGGSYPFAVNGQTGKIVGDLPADNGAVWKYRALYTGVTALLFSAVSFLMQAFSGGSVLGGLVIGFLISLIATAVMKKQLQSVAQKREASDYVRRNSMHVDVHTDRFLYRHTDRIPKQQPQQNRPQQQGAMMGAMQSQMNRPGMGTRPGMGGVSVGRPQAGSPNIGVRPGMGGMSGGARPGMNTRPTGMGSRPTGMGARPGMGSRPTGMGSRPTGMGSRPSGRSGPSMGRSGPRPGGPRR